MSQFTKRHGLWYLRMEGAMKIKKFRSTANMCLAPCHGQAGSLNTANVMDQWKRTFSYKCPKRYDVNDLFKEDYTGAFPLKWSIHIAHMRTMDLKPEMAI